MREIIQHWWVLAARAALAAALAVTIFLLQAWAKFAFLDGITVPVLIVALAVYGVADSFLVFYMGLQCPLPLRLVSAAQGLCGAAIGVLMLTTYFRHVALTWFMYIITAQAVVTGVFELLSGFRFTKHLHDERACFAVGTASLAFAIWLNTGFDGTTSHALDWFLLYAVLLALSMTWFAWTLLRMKRHLEHAHPTAAL